MRPLPVLGYSFSKNRVNQEKKDVKKCSVGKFIGNDREINK